jgi:PTS system nitrogen regulatory IIA component
LGKTLLDLMNVELSRITMKILDVLVKESIIVDLKATDKKGVLEELVIPVSKIANVNSEEMVRVLLDRERLGSTGIGNGIGIPHGKLRGLEKLVLGFGISRKGVDFESMDNRPTYLFFLLITPENSTGPHLKLLARISKILKSEPFRDQLMNANNQDEIFEIIKDADNATEQ